ncbi:hypothetical protein [Paenibacillus spiritus]|uniref:hypothetical protein n=1 Tax=Paenibacillus spiritus TaxID=2496557 RepID=UPI00168B5CFD|nr:hypothetical protein [Paenibacillus spiritus]
MFSINIDRYSELLEDAKSGDLTYSELIELRDKTKDILEDIESAMDQYEKKMDEE